MPDCALHPGQTFQKLTLRVLGGVRMKERHLLMQAIQALANSNQGFVGRFRRSFVIHPIQESFHKCAEGRLGWATLEKGLIWDVIL